MGAKYVEKVGPVTVVLEGNNQGMRELLVDNMFIPTLMERAEIAKTKAEAAAKAYPTKDWGTAGSQRRTQIHYENSFETEFLVETAGGTARVAARVKNTNPFALYIEYGNSNIKPARRFLRTAAGIYRFDAPGDIYG